MERIKYAAVGLIGLTFLLTGAAEAPPEQKTEGLEETLEYFAIWNDELYEDGFVIDSKGREYSLDNFTESEKKNIYNYQQNDFSIETLLNQGFRADLEMTENNSWKMKDKEGRLIGEDVLGDCWFGTQNQVYPIVRDLQTGLFGVRGEQFQTLLPSEFKHVSSVQGPFFSCETVDREYQIWNAETGKMEWQAPEPFRNNPITFYNGSTAVVQGKEEDSLFCLNEAGNQGQRRFSNIIVISGENFNSQYGFYEAAGFSCQEDKITRFLDLQGNELFSIPEQCSINYVTRNRFLVHVYEDRGDSVSYLVNQRGEPLLKEKKYEYIYTDCNKLVGRYQMNHLYGRFLDILSTDGSVLIEGISQLYQCGETCAYITKGFSTGLMDYKGNWIWKRSIFQSLID